MSSSATVSATGSRGHLGLIIATSLMLFSMYFGAGNLIFPPMLGAKSGTNFPLAIAGFLIGGVALPVIAMVAVAVAGGKDVRQMARRGGRFFEVAFPVVVYLSIGAFYALPRTGAVSYQTTFVPIAGYDTPVASALFNVAYFGITLALALNPSTLVDKLGKVLTPALLVLLALLIIVSAVQRPGEGGVPQGEYALTPTTSGLLEGYMTMDSMASLAFGILVLSTLRERGVPERKLVGGTSLAGLIAGGFLALIYVGLGMIGRTLPGREQYSDGAAMLVDASRLTLGSAGQYVFSGIVLLACFTTSIGLTAATSEFFHRLLPKVSYRAWAVIFTLVSWSVASLGLKTMLGIAAPVIVFIYPVTMTVVAMTLLDAALRGAVPIERSFFLAVWTATAWSGLTALMALAGGGAEHALDWMPLQSLGLGWIVPTVIAAGVGLALDASRRGRTAVVHP